jgi:hypothetical protein
MPIQRFTNTTGEKSISVKGKSTIRVINAVFSKGLQEAENLQLEINFLNVNVRYTLPFKGPAATGKKQDGLYFYNGKGIVFAIPLNCEQLIMKITTLKNVDYELVLTYDFYPGGI